MNDFWTDGEEFLDHNNFRWPPLKVSIFCKILDNRRTCITCPSLLQPIMAGSDDIFWHVKGILGRNNKVLL